MLPFLRIQTRPDTDVAEDEFRTTSELGGFRDGQLVSIRLDQELSGQQASTERLEESPIADDARPDTSVAPRVFDWDDLLDRHSGIILVGSPFNSSDPEEDKSELQIRVEVELRRMLDRVVARDYPLLGACYGVGTLGLHQGAVVDRTYGESAGPISITLTEAGREDPLLEGLPETFEGFVGHKEAIRTLPEHAELLATGTACPVQMFRIGRNMYATQFHPELDEESLLFRLRVYSNHGYFDPDDVEATFAAIRASSVTEPAKVLANFRRVYQRD